MAITVLGKTFETEEERREYFRKELRKKLPELKKMEGFPIGEDEDIIEVSDPPYYTACPNPWLNDFIEVWEKEKENIDERDKSFEVDKPFASDVSVGKHNPIYLAHSYHTKVPHPAIMRYLLHYTQPGDIVFDGFAGTGMTGVAAQFCEDPKPKLKSKIESEFKSNNISKPVWGKRNAICGDLSPVASFIAANYNTKIDHLNFIDSANNLLDEVEEKFGWLYETVHDDGRKGKINFVVWSDVFVCGNCGNEIIFYEVAVDEETGKVSKRFNCSICNTEHTKRKLDRSWENEFDYLLGKVVRKAKKIPVRVNYSIDGEEYFREVTEFDKKNISNLSTYLDNYVLSNDRMPFGSESRRNDRQGITHVHHFFTQRTLVLLNELFKRADKKELKLLLNSQLANLSLLNRHRPNVSYPYNPLSGTLYISSQIAEANIFKAYRNKVKRIAKAFQVTQFNQCTTTVSASDTSLEKASVDYIFTDPPFGANIMYSELNYISESFLKVITKSEDEAVESRKRNKTLFDYQTMMYNCFKHYFEILKPNSWMTVVFSNTSAAVWNGIQTAIQNSGFIVANISALDKQEGSFKAINTLTAVKQDLVISCYKQSSKFDQRFKKNQEKDIAIWDFVEEHLNHLPVHLQRDNSTTAIIERSPKVLFDRLVSFYVQKGLSVPLDAGKFQKGLRERFIERDGMFFTNEQVQEYDRKKAEVPKFTQLSILVASEQDGILWLQNFLKDEPKTYQDIQPEWMQALGGERKGDIIPELKTILEENFLKNDAGEWFVPDPNKEEDLEKLRNRRLLKQFGDYKEQAFKPKGKIKECRVEALRAGFKQSYQDKDFETIVRVGDRIPENLLMEDEVLLQFYDIAAGKV